MNESNWLRQSWILIQPWSMKSLMPESFSSFMARALHDPQRGYYARRVQAIEAELKRLNPAAEPAPEQPRPYVGLKTLLTSGGKPGSSQEA